MNSITFHGWQGSAVFMRTLRHHLFLVALRSCDKSPVFEEL